ncbi:MAG TPA: hypothetical protein VFJ53_06465 [Solirubrobacterales bacterium]|nr:hypothetical protein [Solirubrobacterales bacterium]
MKAERRGFVKFFGQGSNRSNRKRAVLDAVVTSGSHRICTYPRGRRPRAVREGDVMFMGHLVGGPNDIRVYGRAVAQAYAEGRDDAGAEEIARRPWLERWPHFIRVRGLEFVDGTLGDGVSLGELMDELGAHAFGSTAENADRGIGNVDPRQSIRQAAAVRLTEAGTSWLEEELEAAFRRHGKVRAEELDGLDRDG